MQDFIPKITQIAYDTFEVTCSSCKGKCIILRDFDQLVWHCLVCGTLSKPEERSGSLLPCGHDRMYGDRDESMEGSCSNCQGKGSVIYHWAELVQLGFVNTPEMEIPDSVEVKRSDKELRGLNIYQSILLPKPKRKKQKQGRMNPKKGKD